MFDAVDAQIANAYQLPVFLANHYRCADAVRQKIHALAERSQTQPRDVFDLHVLLARTDAPNKLDDNAIKWIDALATPEKALFDVAYLSGGRSRLFAHLPEFELPARFRRGRLREWTRRITASRKRSMVETRIQAVLNLATASESIPAGARRRATVVRTDP